MPPGVAYTYGDDAADLCGHYWFEPDPWQRQLLRDWLARDADGRQVVLTAGLSVPRQNGKNGAVEALEFYLLVTDPDTHILHTAHLVKTCKKAFNRLARVFGDRRHPEISSLVRRISRVNGEEGIYLWHPEHVGDPAWEGASIEYSARSRGSARGFDKISVVVYDEAQELTDEQVEALMFTLGASETDRMILYTGTPPGPNCPGEVFSRTRERITGRPSPHATWDEWGIVDPPSSDSTFEDLEEAVWETNPGMGLRLSIEFTREEFENSTVDGFARERLGMWAPTRVAVPAVPAADWAKCSIQAIGTAYRKKTAMGLRFGVDGNTYWLAGAKSDARGEVAFELVEVGTTEGGTRGLAERLWKRRARVSCLVVDGQSQADTFRDRMDELGSPKGYVVRAKTADVVAASQALVDELKAGTAVHSTEGQEALQAAAATATRRDVGRDGGWAFGGEGGDALQACSLAVRGLRTTKRDPRRRQVML